jgi:uncharacterized protein (TIGR04255 family)
MVFPKSQRVVFNNNPLVQVICQLRFPPILGIVSKEPADFQEKVRATLPLYEKGLALPQEIAAILAQVQIAAPTPEGIVHKFLSEDRTSEIDLTRDFIAVATTKYRRWEEFQQTVRMAMEALESNYRPAFYSRIGLRYRDVIDRNRLGITASPWSELIRGSIIGLLADQSVGGNVLSAQGQTQIDLGSGEFLLLQNGSTPLPSGGQGYAIDADFHTEAKRTGSEVFDVLGRFNREAGNFFRWAITPKLSAALEPMAV